MQSGRLGARCKVEPEAAIALTGLFVHSLHTAIVARDGKLIANLEGNDLPRSSLPTCSRQFWIPPGIEPPKRSSRGVLLTQRVPALNWYIVTLWNFCPGFNSVEGKLGWLGESGKCWVSRQNANRRL